MIGAHASFTMEEASLASCVELAQRLGVGVHIHAAEDPCDERITRERAPQSMVCLKRTSRVLPISGDYDSFVRRGSGVIERTFGPFEDGAFRLDVAAPLLPARVEKGGGQAPPNPPDPQPKLGTTYAKPRKLRRVRGLVVKGLLNVGEAAEDAAKHPHTHPEAEAPSSRPEAESSGSG